MKRNMESLLRLVFRPIVVMLLFGFLLVTSIGASTMGCTSERENKAGEEGETGFVEEAPRIGSKAPSFSLMDLNDNLHNLDNYAGKPVLINFWTTWCPYCVVEMPLMQELHESGQDVAVIAINVQEKKEDVETFIDGEGYTFTVLLDKQAQVSGAYQVRGLPTTFAVDGTGIITAIRVGAFDAEGLAALVESALE